MILSAIWQTPVLGAVIVMAIVGVMLAVRAWPRRVPLSAEERAELAGAPMPLLQKRAWWGLLIGLATHGLTAAILTVEGAAAYWDNDDLRLLVMAIFLAGLFAYVAVVLGGVAKEARGGRLDERDQGILRRAPTVQTAAIVIALAAWVGVLPKMFHEQGAVPVVYLYLMFGSVLLVSLIAQSAGVLLGYWLVARHGQG